MSTRVRFEIGDTRYRGLIYELSSKRHPCKCCGKNKFGLLFRLREPRDQRGDSVICLECIGMICLGKEIQTEKPRIIFGKYLKGHRIGKKRGPKAKPGRKPKRKAKKKKKLIDKLKVEPNPNGKLQGNEKAEEPS